MYNEQDIKEIVEKIISEHAEKRSEEVGDVEKRLLAELYDRKAAIEDCIRRKNRELAEVDVKIKTVENRTFDKPLDNSTQSSGCV